MLETLGTARHHSFPLKIDENTIMDGLDFSKIDVAIDFSTPEAAFKNITLCFEKGIPVISGTTGWLNRFDEATAICEQKGGAFIYASNFSLGVNIFFELNKKLARMMHPVEAYRVEMEETHHIHKLDAPSGTAITLAEGIIENSDYQGWMLEGLEDNKISITAKREGEVPGTHEIQYKSPVDTISIKHTAHNRKGFALGAVIASEWLVDKVGVYSMKDVLNIR